MARAPTKDVRRQQLIDATISAIARRGFARTTLADIAKEAGVSYGVVSFYFRSKDALLLATLEHLAQEYEAFWKEAVRRAGASPAARLDAIIEADFHPAIASRKKIPVWYAFWSEARSRPAYRKLCAELEYAYYRQTCDLCRQIVEEGGYDGLDPHAVAVGLNAMINGLWLDFQIRPANLDREEAKCACRSYLAAVFPAEFAERVRAVPSSSAPSAGEYASAVQSLGSTAA